MLRPPETASGSSRLAYWPGPRFRLDLGFAVQAFATGRHTFALRLPPCIAAIAASVLALPLGNPSETHGENRVVFVKLRPFDFLNPVAPGIDTSPRCVMQISKYDTTCRAVTAPLMFSLRNLGSHRCRYPFLSASPLSASSPLIGSSGVRLRRLLDDEAPMEITMDATPRSPNRRLPGRLNAGWRPGLALSQDEAGDVNATLESAVDSTTVATAGTGAFSARAASASSAIC